MLTQSLPIDGWQAALRGRNGGIARCGLDYQKTEFARISALGEIGHSHRMAMIPAGSARLRRDAVD